MNRLNAKNIDQFVQSNPSIEKFSYDRESLQSGIVHLGIGAFHRAHQAFYTEAVLNRGGGDWGIVGASLRSASVKTQLEEQDGLYTLVERGPEGEKFQVIGAVKSVVVGPEDPQALLSLMADSAIKIVSLTVTEKGYCHDPASGNLNLEHADIQHDLSNIGSPKSAVGYIVAALKIRKENGVPSFTVMSCDNLPNNGHVLANTVLQFAKALDPELAEWIQSNTSFPCTMIDRIVPATTESDRAGLSERLGYRDEGMVSAEPFTQWVIEDNFCNDRPAWEEVGALLVKDVDVYEKMKLRLLNGSHSTLAYCGYLAGKETVSDVMQEPAFVNLCTRFMDDEAGNTLVAPEGFDIQNYKKQLRERFANPELKHRTWQIAMDGSQKLPQRLLETLREQLASGGSIDILCLAVAAWIRYVSGEDENGAPIDVQDPYVDLLREKHESNKGQPSAIVREIIGIKEIFGSDLISQSDFVNKVSANLEAFYSGGILALIKSKYA